MMDDTKLKTFVEKTTGIQMNAAQEQMFKAFLALDRLPCKLCRRTRKSPKNKQTVFMRTCMGFNIIPVCAECKQREEKPSAR